MDEKPKAKIATRPWDAAEHLETDADMAAYLEAREEGDAAAAHRQPRSAVLPAVELLDPLVHKPLRSRDPELPLLASPPTRRS